MKCKISEKAREDLISIWEYTFENWSLNQADRYYQIIIDKFDEICSKPDIGKSYETLRKGYWGAIVKSHIIFYRLKSKNEIEIIRILHQRMDLKSRLNE
ncbi:MAG TPA: type II toxin-antitoxin system RelE/ParE family toxin [Bacteroidetes bacterium]|nr:type II toxin-antitoxin system RelE/ParE family toxin [Bacteroidota bacterium]